MKKYILLWLMILLTFSGCAADKGNAPEQQKTDASSGNTTQVSGAGVEISCMTFNILSYNTGGTTYPEPEERYKGIIPHILEQNCDIVGIQEADEEKEFDWPTKIAEDTKGVYTARRIDEEFEHGGKMNIGAGLMILYRTDRFELLKSGATYYWEDFRRWYQWVLLKDKKANREIYVTNTHWSINPLASDKVTPDVQEGNFLRCSEAEELVTFWEETVGDTALFATGDYNCLIDSEPHTEYLRRGIYSDTCSNAIDSDLESSVDFIYYNPNTMDIDRYDLLPPDYTFEDGSKVTMSDHCSAITYATYK